MWTRPIASVWRPAPLHASRLRSLDPAQPRPSRPCVPPPPPLRRYALSLLADAPRQRRASPSPCPSASSSPSRLAPSPPTCPPRCCRASSAGSPRRRCRGGFREPPARTLCRFAAMRPAVRASRHGPARVRGPHRCAPRGHAILFGCSDRASKLELARIDRDHRLAGTVTALPLARTGVAASDIDSPSCYRVSVRHARCRLARRWTRYAFGCPAVGRPCVSVPAVVRRAQPADDITVQTQTRRPQLPQPISRAMGIGTAATEFSESRFCKQVCQPNARGRLRTAPVCVSRIRSPRTLQTLT